MIQSDLFAHAKFHSEIPGILEILEIHEVISYYTRAIVLQVGGEFFRDN